MLIQWAKLQQAQTSGYWRCVQPGVGKAPKALPVGFKWAFVGLSKLGLAARKSLVKALWSTQLRLGNFGPSTGNLITEADLACWGVAPKHMLKP